MWDLKTGKCYLLIQGEAGLAPISRFKNFQGFGGMISAGFTFNSTNVTEFSEWGFQAAWPVVMARTVLPKRLSRYFYWLTALAARIGTDKAPYSRLKRHSGSLIFGISTSGPALLAYAYRQNFFAAAVTYTLDPIEITLFDLPDWAVDASNWIRSRLGGRS